MLFLFACSTKKNTFVHRAYHGITTRYNIYFNGNESFKEAKDALSKQTRDNYTNILPVYIYPDKTVALSYSPQWDRTIEKCSKAITKHSMLIKGVEYCKPIDDTYLLMGKAYFYRQDYYDALRVFSYIMNTHTDGNVWADAFTWRAKANLQLNRIEDAEENLEQIRHAISIHKKKKYKQHWHAVMADRFIRQKEYDAAIIHLSELEKVNFVKKDFKTRVVFILGQLYQELEQYNEAAKRYKKVIKRNPIYEMEFNAALNMMLCQKESKHDSKSKLKKMIKDIRNEEYKDQIFYVLAKIDFEKEDTLSAIRNLEASVFWSINNKYQKTVSAIELAEHYFNNSRFIESQVYYDTVLNIIPENFPNYSQIRNRAAILKSLVGNLLIIKTQDSLQRMATMSEQELDQYLNKIITDYEERETERIADEEDKAKMMENSKKSSSGSRSNWYFYNMTQVKLGEQEFRRRWGRRVLEDNWFISDKAMFSFNFENEESRMEEESAPQEEKQEDKKIISTGTRINDPTNKQYYIQDVPKTDEEILGSNEMIANALYLTGFIYADDLNDKEKAIQQWENLLKRYPEHKLKAPTSFQLYRLYNLLNNTQESDKYKNIILTEYPESDFAKIIQNPDYYQEIEQKKKEAQYFYTNLYDLYINQQYKEVISNADKGLELYLDPDIRKKISYLKAISMGKISGEEVLKTEIASVSKTYPTTDIDTLASGVLEALKRYEFEKNNTKKNLNDSNIISIGSTEKYTYKDDNFHFVIILVDIKELKVDKLKLSINNFNKEFFRLSKFDLSNFYIDNTQQMVTISRFENKQQAMEYYHVMKTNQTHLQELNKAKQAKIYVISDDNYTLFFKNINLRDSYNEFFVKYYLEN